jgi:FAD:protein FMN transferase
MTRLTSAPTRPPGATPPVFVHTFEAMTTRCELQLHGVSPAQGREVAHRIQAHVSALARRYNFHAPDSWLTREVNQRRGPAVPIDEACAQVLAVVRDHAQRTGGAFDITVGTLSGALRQARTPAEVAAVHQRMAPWLGLERWQVEGSMLRFDNPHTLLDLGGVIKEHAVDESARLALAAGVPAGIVNFGGDLYAFGRKAEGQRFVAAVPNPLAPQRMLFGLDLEDQALTTSAHYARRRALPGASGAVLSHVVGDRLEQARWISASVVSHSALVSGIYSTALLVRDPIDLPPTVTAVTVDRDGRIHTFTGAPAAPVPTHSEENTRTVTCA